MKKFSKIVPLLLCAALVLALTACNQSTTSGGNTSEGNTSAGNPSSTPEPTGTDYPSKGITLICPFAAGGGMDTTSRLLAPYLEKALGVTVTVENVEGANGWSGWTRAINSDPDGYTLVYCNYPQMITGYLNPSNAISYTFRNLAPVANHVKDPCVVVVNVNDSRFSDFDSFIAYAKENEVTIGTGGAGSDDHILAELINKSCGTKLTPVHCSNTAEAIANLYGNHIDAVVGNVADFYTRFEAGECLVLAVADTVRSDYMPGVPTTVELGINVTGSSCRGVMAPVGMDEAVFSKLMEAVEQAMTNPDHQAAAEAIGATLTPLYGDDFVAMMEEQETNISGLSDVLGW